MRALFTGTLFSVILLLFTLGALPADMPNGPALGSVAPAFVLPGVSGRPASLADYRGRIVVLNFWAFWCDTWKAEMPSLRELAEQQQEENFQIVAVSVDGTRRFEFDRHAAGPVPFPVLLDGGGHISALYHIHHVPTVILIGPDGRVRYTAYGYPGNRVVLSEIRKIAPAKPRP